MTYREIVDKALVYIEKIFNEDSSGHDASHTRRVFTTSIKIAKKEKKADLLVVALASLLHDVDDYKLFPDNKNYENARHFMSACSIGSRKQTKVVKIISEISFKGSESVKPTSIEGMIVQDADRLDAIGAIGIARAFAYGGAHGRKIYDPKETVNKDQTFEEYKNNKTSTIAHFYEKLLLLKDMMNTKEGKRLAKVRNDFMQRFLNEFYKEVKEDS
ncbi:MAG: HD domain-containing protein [Bacilli bacterium]